MWVTSSLTTVLKPTAVALGNFDGVHRGHRQVIQPALDFASHVPAIVHPTVLTFYPHPRQFFTGQSRPLLTPLNEKISQLQRLGVTQLVLLHFDRTLANLTPSEFVESILVKHLQAKQVSVGADFHFGKDRTGTASVLQEIASRYGIEVTIVPLELCQEGRISSSTIRESLEQGDLQQANRLLGRPYSLMGQVVQGQQLGRQLGFPTANLQLSSEKFIPRNGVYGVRVDCAGCNVSMATIRTSQELRLLQTPQRLPGVMNIGYRPTVDGTARTIEVHLLDWSGDLYGKMLTVELEAFLRPEQKFASLEELKTQIQVDCEAARKILLTPPVQQV